MACTDSTREASHGELTYQFSPECSNFFDRHALDTGRPLVRLDLPPGFPEDVLSPDCVIKTLESPLLILLGGAVEGSLQFPDWRCSVGSREAIGPP